MTCSSIEKGDAESIEGEDRGEGLFWWGSVLMCHCVFCRVYKLFYIILIIGTGRTCVRGGAIACLLLADPLWIEAVFVFIAIRGTTFSAIHSDHLSVIVLKAIADPTDVLRREDTVKPSSAPIDITTDTLRLSWSILTITLHCRTVPLTDEATLWKMPAVKAVRRSIAAFTWPASTYIPPLPFCYGDIYLWYILTVKRALYTVYDYDWYWYRWKLRWRYWFCCSGRRLLLFREGYLWRGGGWFCSSFAVFHLPFSDGGWLEEAAVLCYLFCMIWEEVTVTYWCDDTVWWCCSTIVLGELMTMTAGDDDIRYDNYI